MLFSSPLFLFGFLPVVLLLYYLVPNKLKNLILLISSLVFYTWGENSLVLIMILTILVNYFSAIIIEAGKRKLGLFISVFVSISSLVFFKYFNFTFDNFHIVLNFLGFTNIEFLNKIPIIALPIGISFYTFHLLSYTIDVYRGHVKANRNILNFATYVTMFPQLVAGPIVRYIDVEKQLINKNINLTAFAIGIERFIIGLFKKMIIANYFASIADAVFSERVQDVSSIYLWAGVIAYSFQIYYDFSGYSDMAIGLGKMFGFDFLENFNYPYISKSIKEFWRRWHISLSSWFKDYLYIPLGGSRVPTVKLYFNLLFVFFVTGLWHGASWNFIVWGFFHGFFIVLERWGLERILVKLWTPFQHLYALLVVVVAWVFFRADNLDHALNYLHRMFIPHKGDPSIDSYINFFHINIESFFILLLAILLSTKAGQFFNDYMNRVNISSPVLYNFLSVLKLAFIFILFPIAISYASAGTYNPFIYFRF